jgi:hypothetical protein
MLSAMFDPNNAAMLHPTKDNEYFIDRDGYVFRYVLQFYRTGKVPWPSETLEDKEMFAANTIVVTNTETGRSDGRSGAGTLDSGSNEAILDDDAGNTLENNSDMSALLSSARTSRTTTSRIAFTGISSGMHGDTPVTRAEILRELDYFLIPVDVNAITSDPTAASISASWRSSTRCLSSSSSSSSSPPSSPSPPRSTTSYATLAVATQLNAFVASLKHLYHQSVANLLPGCSVIVYRDKRPPAAYLANVEGEAEHAFLIDRVECLLQPFALVAFALLDRYETHLRVYMERTVNGLQWEVWKIYTGAAVPDFVVHMQAPQGCFEDGVLEHSCLAQY